MTKPDISGDLEELLTLVFVQIPDDNAHLNKTALRSMIEQKINDLYILKTKVMGAIPKKRPLNQQISTNDNSNIMHASGYNQAIDDIKTKLEIDKNE